MSIYTGSEGIVKISEKIIAEIKSWNIEEVSDIIDASVIGTKWRKHISSIKSWSGSIDAFWDSDDENGQNELYIGKECELKLYPQGKNNN